LKPSITAFLTITLVTTTLTVTVFPQSGRTRSKVAPPLSETTKTPPEPIKIPEAAAVVKQEQAGTTSRFVLRNGMTIIISEHHATPIAAAVAFFKAGSSDEPWSTSGPARLLERLILDGTVLRPGDRAVADLRALGASIETSTSYDGAAYSIAAPSDKIKDVLTIQADMLQSPALDPDAIRREVPRVIEEARRPSVPIDQSPQPRAFTTRTLGADVGDQGLSRLRNFDDSAAYSMARLFNLAFPAGASLNTEAWRSLTREQLLDHYRTHYRPDNLIVSIGGDVSTFSTLVEIQQLYGDFGVKPKPTDEQNVKATDVTKPKAASGRPSAPATTNTQQASKPDAPAPEKPSMVVPASATEQTKLRYAAERADISQAIVSAGFRVPGAESKDWPAIKVLTALAGHGRASRLSRSLIDTQMVANRIGSWTAGDPNVVGCRLDRQSRVRSVQRP